VYVCKVCLVFIAVASVIVYRIIMTVDYCVLTSPAGCLLLTSVISAVLNAAAILILGNVSLITLLLNLYAYFLLTSAETRSVNINL